jgi:phosphoribosyl 1,2-cyclic phosphate phosphodiesterase
MKHITILGCGGSTGVPMIGCECAVCTSNNPKNKRSRVSVLVQQDGKNILIDTSPDLRQQALAHSVSRIDAVVYTHAHADHTHGIDDLRAYNFISNQPVPIYADSQTMERLKEQFSYVFMPSTSPIWYRPCVDPRYIPEHPLSEFDVFDLKFIPILQQHGKHTSLGFRIGNFAYSTDVNGFSKESMDLLRNLDVWVVDCLRYSDSATHSKLEMTLEWIREVQPKRAILTHMAHDFDYDKLRGELPSGVEPAYDGMQFDCR